MGNESNSESNCSKTDSSSNSADTKDKLEEMNCRKENENTIIKRVWIVKKSISLFDGQIFASSARPSSAIIKKVINGKISYIKTKTNPFIRSNRYTPFFKHWATILELSNGSYVNIQFGRNGFSLEEFNKTNIEGENLINSIIETWGQDGHPFSFCFLGKANYEYDNLIKYLKDIKMRETKNFEEKGKAYYNFFHYNCQHFSCEIEKLLFGKIQAFHSFNYYIEEFFRKFFSNIRIETLKNLNYLY